MLASMGLLVSVPCQDCGRPVYFGDSLCRSCGVPVTAEVREVLDERLDATGGDFTTMRRRLMELSWSLIVLACVRVLSTIVLIAAGASLWVLLDTAIVISAMLVGAATARRHPRKAILLVAVVWGGFEFIAGVMNPLMLLEGWLFKLVTLVFVVRGFYAAQTADRIRAELAREADAAAKAEFRPA